MSRPGRAATTCSSTALTSVSESRKSFGASSREASAAQGDLMQRFLAGNVEAELVGRGIGVGGLQEQSGLAQSRVAGEQDQHAGHEAAAEDAVEFGQADGAPGLLFDGDVGHRAQGFGEPCAGAQRA